MKKLAGHTGGKAHFPRDVEECRRTMKGIAEELHAQYGVGYYPSRPLSEGDWRDVRIVLTEQNSKLRRVRAQSGYRAIVRSP